MLWRAALLLLSIWTLVLPLRHTLLDADWAIGSKHPFDGGALDVATTAAKTLVGGEANTTAALVAQVSLPLALVLAPSRRVGAVAAVGVAAWQWAMAASTVKPSKAAPLCLTRGLCSLAPLALADELRPTKAAGALAERAWWAQPLVVSATLLHLVVLPGSSIVVRVGVLPRLAVAAACAKLLTHLPTPFATVAGGGVRPALVEHDAEVFGALQPPWMRRPELSSPMAVQYFTLVVAPATLLVGTAWRPLSTPLFLFGALATAAHAFDEYPAWAELLPPKAWEDLLGGPTVKYSGGHLAGADVEPLLRADGSFNVNRAEDPSGERRSQIDRTLFRGRAAVRYLAVWNAPAYPDRPLTAPEKARGPWTTKDYLSRVLQETSNEMVDALLAATQADLINAFCRMLSISGCFLLFAVRRPRGAAASKKEKVA